MPADTVLWLTGQLRAQYPDSWEAALAGLSARRVTSLRVNTLNDDTLRVIDALGRAGLSPERASFYGDALVLPAGSEKALRALPEYENGAFYMQSLSAMLPPMVLDARPGEDILDMCAAPGGKTSQIAQLTDGRAMITAAEPDRIRAERLRANLRRLGVSRVTVIEKDARRLDDFLRFDRILLDAPCSGSGTLDLSDPRGSRAFSEKLAVNSARLQKELIRKAAGLLKKGGTLVYSTCSLLKAENEDVVQSALKLPGLTLEPLDFSRFPGVPALKNSLPGTLTVCPTDRYEGFYLAVLKKS